MHSLTFLFLFLLASSFSSPPLSPYLIFLLLLSPYLIVNLLFCRLAGVQSSAGLPLFAGSVVPTYLPSLVPRGRAGSPHAPDMGLHPTSPEALDDLLKQLKLDRRTLEVRCHSCIMKCARLHIQSEYPEVMPQCSCKCHHATGVYRMT